MALQDISAQLNWPGQENLDTASSGDNFAMAIDSDV